MDRISHHDQLKRQTRRCTMSHRDKSISWTLREWSRDSVFGVRAFAGPSTPLSEWRTHVCIKFQQHNLCSACRLSAKQSMRTHQQGWHTRIRLSFFFSFSCSNNANSSTESDQAPYSTTLSNFDFWISRYSNSTCTSCNSKGMTWRSQEWLTDMSLRHWWYASTNYSGTLSRSNGFAWPASGPSS